MAYAVGAAGVIFGIGVWDSSFVTWISLIWAIGVMLYARSAFRCPLCGASVLHARVGRSLRWVMGRDRRCFACGADYEVARAEIARQAAGGTGRPDSTGNAASPASGRRATQRGGRS